MKTGFTGFARCWRWGATSTPGAGRAATGADWRGDRGNRAVLLVAGLPLLLALAAAAAGGRVHDDLAARPRSGDRQRVERVGRVGRFTREEAARRAQDLVGRVSGVPAGAVEAVDVEVYTDGAKRAGAIPGRDEWDVSCRTAATTAAGDGARNEYLVRLDAHSGEPILVRTAADMGEEGAPAVVASGAVPGAAAPGAPALAPKESDGANAGAEGNGDLRRRGTICISRREGVLWARRYLSAVGLPLPKGAKPVRDRGYDFTFQCAGAHGAHGSTRRTLRVRVSPRDGSLQHLHNVVYRGYPAP